MISCGLSLGTQVALVQSLQLIGGATDSIFPQVEALLQSTQEDYQAALECVAARKNMGRYHSVVDFMFCELHPEWQLSCRKYYAGMGPQLKDQITPAQLVEFNHRLIIGLDIALSHLKEKRKINWGWYKKLVGDAAKTA